MQIVASNDCNLYKFITSICFTFALAGQDPWWFYDCTGKIMLCGFETTVVIQSFSHYRKSLFWLVSFPRLVLWHVMTIPNCWYTIMYNPCGQSTLTGCPLHWWRVQVSEKKMSNERRKETNKLSNFWHGTCSKWACVELRGIHCL